MPAIPTSHLSVRAMEIVFPYNIYAMVLPTVLMAMTRTWDFVQQVRMYIFFYEKLF